MKLYPCNNGEVYIQSAPNISLKFLRHPLCGPEITFSTEGLSPIPRIIHQTWATSKLPLEMQKAVDAMKAAHPGWSHHLYDDDTARRFIIQHFGSHVAWAYDTLIPGAYKADLFRYCVMYIYGGVYLDIKYIPVNGFSFESWINEPETYICEFGPFVYQGCFMCPPKHPRLKAAIDAVVRNVRMIYFGDCHVCTTGPHMFGRLFTHAERSSLKYGYRNKDVEIYNRRTGDVLMRQYEGYRSNQNDACAKAGKKYWQEMWKERTIFDAANYKSKFCPPDFGRHDNKLTLELMSILQKLCLTQEDSVQLEYNDNYRILTSSLPVVDTDSIPKALYMYWHSEELPPHMVENITYIKNKYPDFALTLYTDNMASELISKYFTNEVVAAYHKLIPFAFKADLFRLCILYVFGGFYIDVKYRFSEDFSLNDITDTLLIRDREEFFPNRCGVYNAFICVKPREKFIMDAICKLTYNCHNDYYGPTCLYPTGPGLLGLVIPSTFAFSGRFNKEITSDNEIDMILDNNNNIICKSYLTYRAEQKATSTKRYYSDMWNDREIYDNAYNMIPEVIHISQTGLPAMCNSVKEYTAEAIEELLIQFNPIIKWAYNSTHSNTQKMLLQRYCTLYMYGGIFASDCELLCDIKMLLSDKSHGMILCDNDGRIYENIVGFKKYSPICLHMIKSLVHCIRNQYYGNSVEDLLSKISLTSRIVGNKNLVKCCVKDDIISLTDTQLAIASCKQQSDIHNKWESRCIYKLDNYPCPY